MSIAARLTSTPYVETTTPGVDGPVHWRMRRLSPELAARYGLVAAAVASISLQRESVEQTLQRDAASAHAVTSARQEQLRVLGDMERAHGALQAAQQLGDEEGTRKATEQLDALRALYAELDLQAQQGLAILRRQQRQPDPRKIGEAIASQQQMLCDLVVAARDEGEDWEDITLVADEAHHDPVKGRVYVGMLDAITMRMLCAAAWAPVQEAAERLRRFRGARAGDGAAARAAGPGGAEVRHASE